jgi:O-antigen ligase
VLSARRSRPDASGQRFVREVILQTLVAALPAAFLLAAGRATAAEASFWGVLGLLLLRLIVLRRPDQLLCLLLAVAPFVNLLRGYLFYNVVVALYGSGLLYRFVLAPRATASRLRHARFALLLAAYLTVYYIASLAVTAHYDVNLRVFELVFALGIVLIIGRHAWMLTSALCGLLVSTIAVGLALLPHLKDTPQGRLGIVWLEGVRLGNPIQLGLPLALSLLALAVDRGAWLGLRRRPLWRVSLVALVLVLLALTTSRAGWMVSAIGIAVILLFRNKERAWLAIALLAGGLGLLAVTQGPLGRGLFVAAERTFGDDRTVRNRTSGRSDQWIVAYKAVTISAGRLLAGYGPGMGPSVYARVSGETPDVKFHVGEEMALHSFYMQVAVEGGLLALVPLATWLAIAGARIVRQARRRSMTFPLVSFLGYVLIALTVSGYDVVSGIFLGIGLLAVVPAAGVQRRGSGGLLDRRSRRESVMVGKQASYMAADSGGIRGAPVRATEPRSAT